MPEKRLENEVEIIEKAKTDDDSFGILYDFYFPKIYFFVLKRIGQKEVSEDIVSIVFIKAFSNLKKFKPQSSFSFSAWLFRIAVNEMNSHFRQAKKMKLTDLDEIENWLADDNLDVLNSLSVEDDKKKIREVLSDLPDKERNVIQLKFYEELSNIEIAEILDVSANHIGVMLHRAIKKFRLNYEKYGK